MEEDCLHQHCSCRHAQHVEQGLLRQLHYHKLQYYDMSVQFHRTRNRDFELTSSLSSGKQG